MEYDEIMGARLSALESRISAVEQQLFMLMQGSTTIPKRRRRELTPEEKQAVRARLVAGQEKARAKREAELKREARGNKNGKESGKETNHEG